MTTSSCFRAALFITVLAGAQGRALPHTSQAAEGSLMAVGGGLRPDHASIFRRLIDAAGGAAQCRLAVFTTASKSPATAERFRQVLETYGVAEDRVVVVDLRPENTALSASDPELVAELERCTGAFFVGGDQGRIAAMLRRADGGETPVLAALWKLWRRGGLIAGTSAGAAMQSDVMIAISGLPEEMLDEGMDALDFGIVHDPRRRGLLVSRGLGFFANGIIDQHFNQYRGRLGRLALATVSEKVRFGVGIDENTAIVATNDQIEVLGAGCVTILDAADAACDDGPLGRRIQGLRVSCLQNGDRFDLRTGAVVTPAGKRKIVLGPDANRGNYLIADIAGMGAVPLALFAGLANNTSHAQEGVMLRYTHHFGHGYRVTFRKTQRTVSWTGVVDYVTGYAIQDVDVMLEPIVASLRSPASCQPPDLPQGKDRAAWQALWFRGILLEDEQGLLRPDEPMTRAELAAALAHAVHLLPPLEDGVAPADVPADSPFADDIAKVLEARLMALNKAGQFRPEAPVSRDEAVTAFARFATFLYGESAADQRFSDPLVRREAATAIYRLLGFPW